MIGQSPAVEPVCEHYKHQNECEQVGLVAVLPEDTRELLSLDIVTEGLLAQGVRLEHEVVEVDAPTDQPVYVLAGDGRDVLEFLLDRKQFVVLVLGRVLSGRLDLGLEQQTHPLVGGLRRALLFFRLHVERLAHFV